MIELIERSSEFVGVSDLAGKPRYLNAAGFELVGLSNLEQASRMSILDFLAPEERSRAEAELMPHVIESGRWFGELNFCHFKTGENIPFLVDWFRIDDVRSGRPMDIATVSRDLRGQKKLEADLRGLNGSLERRVTERTSELAQALDRLTIESLERTRSDARAQELQLALFHASRLSTAGQMAGALAHELNQPLTAFTNSVNAARRLAAKRPLQRVDTLCEVLEEAVAQALRAGEIIRRLREFVTRGETELRIENLSDLIREACHLAFAGMAAHGNKVELLLDKRAETILANKIQLQQVILNLLRNAFEAQSEGPDVKLTTRKLDDGGTDISIADRGPGVPAEMIEHLFEPFYTTKRDGMGLGLSISRTIVEAHGGKLKCEPNPGGGAIFCIMLPLAIER
jgi:C4-dicarboxylate-specific signal transduction histidine kinase